MLMRLLLPHQQKRREATNGTNLKMKTMINPSLQFPLSSLVALLLLLLRNSFCTEAYVYSSSAQSRYEADAWAIGHSGVRRNAQSRLSSSLEFGQVFQYPAFKQNLRTPRISLSAGGQGSDNPTTNGEAALNPIEIELARLQDQLSLIEALESRNEAQLESFVDKEDQWESLEEEERELLQSKESILNRMEVLTEELIQLWMGAKSNDG